MSTISSLYGSPKSSMMSRDPTGLDPSGVDDSIARLEPAGSRADESFDHHDSMDNENQLDPKLLIAVADLVGVPPPPPKTPPPKKSKRRTPRGKSGLTPRTANVGSFNSFDDDSLLHSLASPMGAQLVSPTGNGEATFHTRNTGDKSPDSVKVDSPPREQQPVTGGRVKPSTTPKDIVEQRVKAALAMYESEDLVLDDQHQNDDDVRHQVLRPSLVVVENKPEVMPELPDSLESVKMEKVNKPKSPGVKGPVPPSPSSEATRPHSNKTMEDKSFAGAMTILSNINESPHEAASPARRREPPPTPESRPRRTTSVERRKLEAKEEKQKRDQKRGFFKKLFRGRTKSRVDPTRETAPVPSSRAGALPRSRASPRASPSPISHSRASPSPKAHPIPSPSPRSKSSPRSTPREAPRELDEALVEAGWRPARPSPRSSSQPRPLKPALKSAEERQYQGSKLFEPEVDVEPENVFDEPPHESPKRLQDESSSTPTSEHSQEASTESFERAPRNSFSQDPPDDEHGDPPVFSGRPLVSPTSLRVTTTSNEEDEKSRVESVKSRIAEVYEDRAHGAHGTPDEKGSITRVPSDLSQDQNGYFFAQQDEVSTLTGTFGSKSFDPLLGENQDGSQPETEDSDPFGAPFLEKETVDSSLPTPSHLANLRVNVHGPSQDPAGASPMKWDYRGNATGFRDPIGESPLHAWKAKDDYVDDVDDPPLTTGFVDNDEDSAAEEEKKEDEDPTHIATFSSSTTPFERDFDDSAASSAKLESKPSRAIRAALKLAQVTGLDAIKERVDSIPTPKYDGSGTKGLGSDPLTEAASSDKAITVNNAGWSSSSGAAYFQKIHGEAYSRNMFHEKVGSISIPAGELNPSDEKLSRKKEKDGALQTDVVKSGFKSASNTPVNGKKSLTVTTAAFTNAKAVEYLHRLQGEPSPRHTWHASRRKKADLSPLALKTKERKPKKKNPPPAPGSAKKPSPNEYSADNFDESLLNNVGPMTPRVVVHLEELHAVKAKEGALFSAYNSKFQGRKPTKKNVSKVETPKGSRLSLGSRGRPDDIENQTASSLLYAELKPGKITGWAVTMGINLRRKKREEDVANGRSARVVLSPKKKTEGRNRFKFVPADESEIKDPIQRAGRRILSKSAVPIQCAIRRYLARREAIDRMWALIEIQSYYRRWRAETNLQANIYAATQIQKSFRGWLARDKLKDMNFSATQIQKIVRGYLCQAKVYDTMYYIVRIQALFRGCYERKVQRQKKEAAEEIQRYLRGFITRLDNYKGNQAIPIQALYRGHKARQEYAIALASVKLLQSTWRGYAAKIAFQIEIVDIIIVQSVVRRWQACRFARALKNVELFVPASIIQALARGVSARKSFKKNLAARKIQTAWRGFQCYTDYIFRLVDILVVQRTARQWLARREVDRVRRARAAVKIQCNWRRHKAESVLVYSLVHIIIAQSVARRFLARFTIRRRRVELESLRAAEQRKVDAATAIQKIWRGFWGFSHYIIVQYEIARLQALVRGKLARQAYNLKLGCAIIIQANIRRHLAKNAIEKKMLSDAMMESAAMALRERNAAKRIQFWWRIVLDWTKEKKAALTIERFFIRVREEVDREIVRRERKMLMKKEKRRQKRRESDEKMLERAWLNTVDENTAVSAYSRDSRSESASRSKSASRARENPSPGRDNPHRTPTLNMNKLQSPREANVGQEVDIHGWPIQRVDSVSSRSKFPTESVRMAASEDNSEVSNITNPTVFNRMGQPPGVYESPGRPSRDKRMSTEDYIKKYGNGGGLKSAPNRMTGSSGQPQHFFSDAESAGSTKRKVVALPLNIPPHMQTQNSTPRNVPETPTSQRMSASTPRSQSGHGFGPSVNARGFSMPSPVNGRGFSTPGSSSRSKSSSTTPRNNLSAHAGVPSTPRGIVSHQVPSPRIPVGFPPVTPRSHKGMNKLHISRRDTAETESQTTYSQNSFSKASPRSRADGHVIRHGSPVMVMKSYPNFTQSHSIEEAQEVMYLGAGSEELGDEYGEV